MKVTREQYEWYYKQLWNGERKPGWYDKAIKDKDTVYVCTGNDIGKRGIIQSYRIANDNIYLNIQFGNDIIPTSIIENAVAPNLQQYRNILIQQLISKDKP